MSLTIKPSRLAVVLWLAMPALVPAQQPHAGQAGNAMPASPAATAPAAAKRTNGARAAGLYKSAFDDYRGFSDEPAVPWREANDRVGRIGGWRAYAREAQAAAPPEAAASRPGATAAPASKAGHGAHKPQ